jgi:hypothetical protein
MVIECTIKSRIYTGRIVEAGGLSTWNSTGARATHEDFGSDIRCGGTGTLYVTSVQGTLAG